MIPQGKAHHERYPYPIRIDSEGALIRTLIILAGIGHLCLVAGSVAIPGTLGWREDTAKLKLLTRQVFWTWAGYVWLTHLCFGLVSVFGSRLLLDGSPLAGLVCGFIATWWAARIVIQFTYFDRSARPPGAIYFLAEGALIGFFGGCAGIYGWAAYTNLG